MQDPKPSQKRVFICNNYLDMPQMLEDEIGQGSQVNLFPIYESWIDIGGPEDYLKAKKGFLY